MNITCPNCNFSKTVDAAKVPDRPVKVNCPKCSEAFTFEKTAQTETSVTGAPEQVTCPACGLVQAQSDNCSGCGVNYAMYQDRQEKNRPGNDDMSGHLAELRHEAVSRAPENQPKAGFWIRVVATILDSVLLSIVQFVLTLGITLLIGYMGIVATDDPATSLVIWLFGMTISLGYAVFFTGYCGQTPGKMVVRIRVIRADGSQMNYGRAAKREILGKFVSSILLGIGYIMVAFDNQKQGLHDKIADTYVIKL
jgi:predicted Zn finger-like uncharacterized protein